MLEGQAREVLCLDTQRDLVATGSMDKTVWLFRFVKFDVKFEGYVSFRLGPNGAFVVVHKLEGHKLKVRSNCTAR